MYIKKFLLLFCICFQVFAGQCNLDEIVDNVDDIFTRNRTQALQKAKDMAGVPRGAMLQRQFIVTGDVTKRGNPNYVYNANVTHQGRYYEYLDNQGQKKFIVEHTNDFEQGNGAHFHAARPNGEDRFSNRPDYTLIGTDEYDGTIVKKYLRINAENGQHHIYYDLQNQ